MNGSARILVVGCGFPQLGLLGFCRAEGLHVIGADQSATAVGVPRCQEFVQVSTVDAEGLAAAARRVRADGITTCGSEAALLPVARAAAAVGLPFYADPAVAEGFRLKHAMRERYAAGGAPCPAYRSARNVDEVRAFATEHGLPLVVKPSRGWGQRGVAVVTTPEELEGAARAALDVAGSASLGEAVCVVEQFIPGREFSVDAYTREGVTEVLAITERIITGYPDPPGITFAEVFPSELAPADLEAVAAAARAGNAALGITRGPTYTQVRAGSAGAFLVETAWRLGGGLDPDVTFLASGVSLYRRIVGMALGRPEWETAGPEAPAHGGATGRFLVAPPGRVRAVEGLTEARALPGVIDAQVYVQPGGLVHPLTDGSKRAGHVLCVGADRAEAEARAAVALRTIRVVTDPSPEAP